MSSESLLPIHILKLNHLEACCCTLGIAINWRTYVCGCNVFGCNCNYANDDICYYGDSYTCPTAQVVCHTNERCSDIFAEDTVSSISANILIYQSYQFFYMDVINKTLN